MQPLLALRKPAAHPNSTLAPLTRRPLVRRLLWAGGVLLAVAWLYWLFAGWGYDDPFITYRYAYNLGHGYGLVYNPGEHVQSTTTPLLALLLTLPSALGADLPRLANLLSVSSLVAGGTCLWRMAHTARLPRVGWVAFLFYALSPLLLATTGSEAPLYLALCLAALDAHTRRRWAWAGVWCGLALLARPDAALVPLLLGADQLITLLSPSPGPPRQPQSASWYSLVRFSLTTLLVALPWFIFAWCYYGIPLPATLAVKQHQGAMLISQPFWQGALAMGAGRWGSWAFRLQAGLVVIGLVHLVGRRSLAGSRTWLLLCVWSCLYFIAFILLGVSNFFWYYAPLVPAWVVLSALGVDGLALGLDQLFSRWSPNRLKAWLYGVEFWPREAILAVLLLALLGLRLSEVVALSHQTDPRLGIYHAAGNWLANNTLPGVRTGTLEVGILGYYAHRPMVDFAGLIQPAVAAQLTPQATYEDAAVWAIAHYHPQYVVLHDRQFPNLEAGWVAGNCHPIQHFLGAPWGYTRDLTIYECPFP